MDSKFWSRELSPADVRENTKKESGATTVNPKGVNRAENRSLNSMAENQEVMDHAEDLGGKRGRIHYRKKRNHLRGQQTGIMESLHAWTVMP